MSQPTRARTIGGATRKPRRESSPPAPLPAGRGEDEEAVHPVAEQQMPVVSPFVPEALARTLRAVAAELERDPALAQRVADAVSTAATAPPASSTEEQADGERTSVPAPASDDASAAEPKPPRVNRGFRPKLVTGASPDLGTGIPDPFALYARLGAEGLHAALAELRLGTLRAIAREHGLDPKGTLARQNDAEKLRAAILKAAGKGRR